VHRCYATLEAQTFRDWEWVVVDDGSTDGTSAAVGGISDPRITLVRYSPNRGRGYARKTALDASAGEWMVVWDVDDLYFPDRLERINEARVGGYDFCVSYAVVATNDLGIKGVRGFYPRSIGLPRFFVHHTLGCRLEIARAIGYDPGLAVGEDTTIALALDDNYRGRFIEDALTVYQEDADVNLEKAIACNVSQLKQLSDMRARRLLRTGVFQYAARRALWRIKLAILQAMRICPRLYNRAMVRLRTYGRTTENYRLGAERIAFIEKFRNPPIR
jgi:glycosyltransferase involved in cell wall biosynthesis